MTATQQKSQESLEWVMEVMCRVHDQMLKQTREFCPDIFVTTNQLDPFQVVPREDVEGGLSASVSSADD